MAAVAKHWAALQLGAGNSVLISHMGGRAQLHELLPLLSRVKNSQESGIGSRIGAQTQILRCRMWAS